MKRDEAQKLTETAIGELEQALKQGHSETLRRFLQVMSRFPQYSLRNCLLILKQKPDAQHVAGFRRWLEVGRYVRKGEKGIGILAPLAYRDKTEAEESSEATGCTIRGFKVVHVFDVSQTE